jgi:hypothetical protein
VKPWHSNDQDQKIFISTTDEYIHRLQKKGQPKRGQKIKNESVTPARKQTYTDRPSAVQCKASLRNSVFMITEIGAQVSVSIQTDFPLIK